MVVPNRPWPKVKFKPVKIKMGKSFKPVPFDNDVIQIPVPVVPPSTGETLGNILRDRFKNKQSFDDDFETTRGQYFSEQIINEELPAMKHRIQKLSLPSERGKKADNIDWFKSYGMNISLDKHQKAFYPNIEKADIDWFKSFKQEEYRFPVKLLGILFLICTLCLVLSSYLSG